MFIIVIHYRNRLIEVSKNLLPIEEDASKVGFRSFSRQQIEYMQTHRTTQLPPGMFKKAVIARTGGKEIIKELAFERFTLSTEYPQNVCLMKDGSIVFCDAFLQPPPSTSSAVEKRPLIAGYKFLQVRCLFNCNYIVVIFQAIFQSRVSLLNQASHKPNPNQTLGVG